MRDRAGETSQSAAGKHTKQLSIAFGINLGLFAAEVVGGLLAGSLALIADAGHMMVDTVAIGLSLGAIYFARRSPTPRRSFGYYRLEILAAVINGVLLFAVGLALLVGAVVRLMHPPTVSSGLMLVFGIVALVGNGIAAWLLLRGQKESLTMRGAFLDFLADALGALAVVIAAIVIATTGVTQADAIASIVIAVLILPRTWKLLGKTVNVLLEATPEGVDLEEVRRHVLETEGVAGCHDLHAWTITSGMNVLSVHVILKPDVDGPQVLDRLGDLWGSETPIMHLTCGSATGHRLLGCRGKRVFAIRLACLWGRNCLDPPAQSRSGEDLSPSDSDPSTPGASRGLERRRFGPDLTGGQLRRSRRSQG